MINSKEFQSYFKGCENITLNHFKIQGFKHEPDKFSFTDGKRYIKVIQGTSAHSFVDKSNGDVLKPASWAKPAKHARGNIFDADNGLKTMGPYG